MNSSKLSSPRLTTILVFAIVFFLIMLCPLLMQTENDYVFYTSYFFYFVGVLFLATWKILKGTVKATAWIVLGILMLVAGALIHLMSLYLIALGAAFQH